MTVKAYLQITMEINDDKRATAAGVYTKYKAPFLNEIEGALTKELLIRDEDVQVMHGFDSVEHAQNYLKSDLFLNDVFKGLQPLWNKDPEVKIYQVA